MARDPGDECDGTCCAPAPDPAFCANVRELETKECGASSECPMEIEHPGLCCQCYDFIGLIGSEYV